MKKFISAVWKAIAYVIIVLALFCLVGKNHFVTGSLLSVIRWPVIALGFIVYLYRVRRKKVLGFRQKAFLLVTALLLIEALWVGIRRESLGIPEGEQQITLLTYNLFFRNKQPDKSLKIIEKANADVLFVQEVTPSWQHYLDKNLSKKYPYRVVKSHGRTQGIGIYSRFPIKGVRYLNNSAKLPYAQLADLKIGDQTLALCNMHLASPAVAVENPDRFYGLYSENYQIRKQQYAVILQEMDKKDVPVKMLVGDLNTPSLEPLYTNICDDWVDLYVESEWDFGWNFPNTSKLSPKLRLDYAFASGKLDVVNAQVLKGGSSDHLAVLFKIQL